VSGICDCHLISKMNETISLLEAVASDWISSGHIPEVDWSRMKSLEFQEALASRNKLVKQLDSYACVLCENFDDHVSHLFLFLVHLMN
jgi:antiviral helicase SKI2